MSAEGEATYAQIAVGELACVPGQFHQRQPLWLRSAKCGAWAGMRGGGARIEFFGHRRLLYPAVCDAALASRRDGVDLGFNNGRRAAMQPQPMHPANDCAAGDAPKLHCDQARALPFFPEFRGEVIASLSPAWLAVTR